MPPSSSESRLTGSEASRMTSLPERVEPVNETLSTPGCDNEVRRRRVGPSAGTTLTTPGGIPYLGRQLAEPQRCQRRLRIRLEDDRAAGGDRGRKLPGGHHHRVVPGDDLRADADRLAQGVEEQRAADRVRAAGDRRDRRARRSGSSPPPSRPRPSPMRSPCRRCAFRARLAPCGSPDRVGERVKEPRALGCRRLAPRHRRVRHAQQRPRDRCPRSPPARRGRAELRSPARRGRATRPRQARRTRR